MNSFRITEEFTKEVNGEIITFLPDPSENTRRVRSVGRTKRKHSVKRYKLVLGKV